MSQYDALLDELETLAKAMDGDGDDKRIAAAAEDGNPDADGDGENDVSGEGGDGDGDGDDVMGKSFEFTLDNGETVHAVDGTELVKSLMQRMDKTDDVVMKALGSAVSLIGKQGKKLEEQDKMIKSLGEKLERLGNEGRGRKAVVTPHEKPAAGEMKKSDPQGMTGAEFMAKAMDAFSAGKITALQVSEAEVCLNKGMAVPAAIIARVMQ